MKKCFFITIALLLIGLPLFAIEPGISSETAARINALQKELGIEEELFRDKFSSLVAGYIDMVEAGMTEDDAMSVLEGALRADPSMKELTTVTAAMIDLHEAGVTLGNSLAMLTLHEGLGVQQEVFLEEVTTITAAMIDMHEAGIAGPAAMAALAAAFKADPSLEEVTTITAAMIDMHEAGVDGAGDGGDGAGDGGDGGDGAGNGNDNGF